MGHRDNLLVTLNLSGVPKTNGCRPHPRGSVRRASGFVLDGQTGVRRAKPAMFVGDAKSPTGKGK